MDEVDPFGPLWDKWHFLGGEASILGRPTGSQGVCPDGLGRHLHFEGGSIHWHPAIGAHETHGGIRDEWARLGWERSSLGYPVSDECELDAGEFVRDPVWSIVAAALRKLPGWASKLAVVGRVSYFQRGRILWAAGRGWVVHH